MPKHDYICKNGHKFARFVWLKDLECPQKCEEEGCDEIAERQLSMPLRTPNKWGNNGGGGYHGDKR